MGYLDTVWHPEKGKGIVLGKYKLTDNKKNEVVDFNEREITAEKDSELYKDALKLARLSGLGYSELDYDKMWAGMDEAINPEDVPQTLNFKQIHVPEIDPEITDSLFHHKIADKIPQTKVHS